MNQRAAQQTHGFPTSSWRKLVFPIQQSLLKVDEFISRALKSVICLHSFNFLSRIFGNLRTFCTYFYFIYFIQSRMHSNLLGLFKAKAMPVEQQWFYLTHCCGGGERVFTFLNIVCPKNKHDSITGVRTRYDVTVQFFNHNTMKAPINFEKICQLNKDWKVYMNQLRFKRYDVFFHDMELNFLA